MSRYWAENAIPAWVAVWASLVLSVLNFGITFVFFGGDKPNKNGGVRMRIFNRKVPTIKPLKE